MINFLLIQKSVIYFFNYIALKGLHKGSSLNLVLVNGVERVRAIREGGQPKSHNTFLNKFLPQKALEI